MCGRFNSVRNTKIASFACIFLFSFFYVLIRPIHVADSIPYLLLIFVALSSWIYLYVFLFFTKIDIPKSYWNNSLFNGEGKILIQIHYFSWMVMSMGVGFLMASAFQATTFTSWGCFLSLLGLGGLLILRYRPTNR